MDTNQTKEPTPTEIMEEVRKLKEEVVKQAQHSRISMWLTPTAFGGSVVLYGLSYLGRLTASPWDIYSSAIGTTATGLLFMVWAQRMATKAEREFKAKWNKLPRD
jgi:hypothetical protein